MRTLEDQRGCHGGGGGGATSAGAGVVASVVARLSPSGPPQQEERSSPDGRADSVVVPTAPHPGDARDDARRARPDGEAVMARYRVMSAAPLSETAERREVIDAQQALAK